MKRITVVIPTELSEKLEKCLRSSGVPGMTVDEVRGFGQHANYFSRDLLRSNVRVEIYVDNARVGEVVEAVVTFAREEHTPAGILTVENIEQMVHLNDGKDISA